MRKILRSAVSLITLLAVLLLSATIYAKPGNAGFFVGHTGYEKPVKDATANRPVINTERVTAPQKQLSAWLTPGHNSMTYSYDGSQLVRTLTLPANATNITIKAVGASGGSYGSNMGGLGALVSGSYGTSLANNTLTIVVGQKGIEGGFGSGGGGGSFVYINGAGQPLVAAGGGGGAGTYDASSSDPTIEGINANNIYADPTNPTAYLGLIGTNGNYGRNAGDFNLGGLSGGDPGYQGAGGGNSVLYDGVSYVPSDAGGGAGWLTTPTDVVGFPTLTGIWHGSSPNDPSGAIGGQPDPDNGGAAGGYGGGGAFVLAGGGGGGGYSGGGGGNYDNNADVTHGGGGGSFFDLTQGTLTSTPTQYGDPGTDGVVVIEWDEPSGCTAPSISTCNSNITIGANLGCNAVVSYATPTVTGTTPIAWTYSFSGATSGSGSGTGSGAVFNKGTTTVTLTATNSCGTANCSFTITVNDTQAPVTPTLSAITAECSATVPLATTTDNCSGTVTGTTTDPLTYNAQGDYTIHWTFTDGSGNSTTANQLVHIKDVTPPTIQCPGNITVNANTTLHGTSGADVTYTATASDNCSTPTITYSIPSGNFFPVGTTTVTATATDAAGLTSTCSFDVTVNCNVAKPTITAGGPLTICTGGAVTLTASSAGGYLWSNGATTQSIQAGAGTYTVTATDGGSCSSAPSDPVTVAANPVPTVNTVANQEVCHSNSTSPVQAISFSGSVPGTVFNWTNDNPSIGLGASGTGDIASFVGANPGNTPVTATITVTPSYTNNGVTCTGTPVSFTITVDPIPVFNAIADQTVCNGTATTAINLTSSISPVTYSWFGGASIGLPNGSGSTIPSFTAVNTGSSPVNTFMIVTSKYDGTSVSCGTSRAFYINVNPTPVATVTAEGGITATCPGGTITLHAGVAPGNTYQWQKDGNPINGATGQDYQATASGSYTVIVTNNGCTSTVSNAVAVSIQDVTAPVTPTLSDITAECSATVTAPTTTDNCSGTVTGTTSDPLTYNAQGDYTIHWTFTDGSGNSTTATQQVHIKDDIKPDVACPGDITVTASATLNGNGGAYVNYSATGTDNCGTPTISYSIAPGSFFPIGNTAVTVTADDGHGNTNTCTFHVIVTCGTPSTIQVTVVNNCDGTSVLTSDGTGNLLWSNNATTPSITVTTGGTYTITQTLDGCIKATGSGVADPGFAPVPVITPGATSVCVGGTVTLTASGGTNYLWNYGPNTASVSNTYSTPGTYTYAVSNHVGNCTSTSAPVTITVNALPANPAVTAAGATVFCTGGSVVLNIGNTDATVTYQWYQDGNAINGATAASYTATQTGSYTVVATNSNGCTATSLPIGVTVNTYPTAPVITTADGTSVCFPNSVPLAATGASSYLWSTGGSGATTTTNNNVGDYTVTVSTSANGCVSTSQPITVHVNPQPTQFNVSGGGAYCASGSGVTISLGNSETGVNYDLLLGGNGTGNTLAGTGAGLAYNNITAAGNYSILATNATTGCTRTMNGFPTVTVNPVPTISGISGNTSICSGSSASLSASSTDGGSNYKWYTQSSGGTPISTTANLHTGTLTGNATFYVEVSNGFGCTSARTAVTVTVNARPANLTFTVANNCDGTSTITANNLTGSILWSTGQTINPISVTTAGVYTATQSANGCTSSVTGASASPKTAPSAAITADGSTSVCPGSTVLLHANTGSGYGYEWMKDGVDIPGSNAPDYTATVSGTYTVIVHSNGCSSVVSNAINVAIEDVTAPVTPTLNDITAECSVTVTAPTTTDNCSGTVTGTTSDPLTYNAQGDYTINWVFTDAAGNSTTATQQVHIKDVTPPTIQCPGSITVNANTVLHGTSGADVTYTATASDNCSTPTITYSIPSGNFFPVGTTTVTATATDAAGLTSTCSFDVTVNCNVAKPTITAGGPTTICSGSPVTLTASTAVGYQWSNGATTQSIQAGAGTYTVTVTDGGSCTSVASDPVTVTENPVPTVNTVANQEVCHNAVPTTAISFTGSVPGTVYSWTNDNPSIGLAASGTGDIASFLGQNPGTAPVTATITVTPSYTNNGVTCTGTPISFTIRVNPIPVIDFIPTQTVCNGSATTAINITGPVPDATYRWVGGAAIGLPNGNGSVIPSFTAINTGSTAVDAIMYAGSYYEGVTGGCGTSREFHIIVNPTPVATVTAEGGITATCPGGTITLHAGAATGNSYQWLKDGNPINGANGQDYQATTSGSYTVIVTNSGCTSAVSNAVAVSIQDVTAPVTPTLNDVTAECSATVTAPTTTDNCSGAVTGTTSDPLTYNAQGDYTIHWTFTDGSGNSTTATQQVHIKDDIKPDVVCPGDITVTANVVEGGNGGTHVNYSATGTDNCGTPTISYSIAPGSFFPIGTTPVTVTADDGHGNTNTCTFNVIVNCVTPVFTTCGTDKTVSNDAGQCGAVVTYNTAASGIPAANLSYTFTGATTGSGSGDGSGSFFNTGQTTVTITAGNVCGNATCSFTIRVNDTEKPLITAPADITVNNDPGKCSAVVSAAGISQTGSANLVAYWKFDEGSGSTVADQSGNNLNGTFEGSLNWVNSTAFTGAGKALQFNGSGLVYVADNPVINTLQSNMTIEAWVYQTDNTNNTIIDRANYNFLFEVNPNGQPGLGFYNPTDGWSYSTTSIPVNQWVHVALTWNGNTHELKFYKNGVQTDNIHRPSALYFNAGELNIGRQSPQTCACNIMNGMIDELKLWSGVRTASEILASATNTPITTSATLGSPVTSDNCGVAGVTNDAPGTYPVGTTNVTWTVTDIHGNTQTAVQKITVVDNEKPKFTCPGDITVNANATDGNGNAGYYATYAVSDATDNCGVQSTVFSIPSGSFFGLGTTPVTVTVTDIHGNVSTCTFNVTVNCVSPVFTTCGTDKTVSNDAGQCGAMVSYTTAASGTPAASLSYTFTGATTGSGSGDGSGSFFNTGTTVVTVTASSICGSSTCTFNVTVNDTEAPVPPSIQDITEECLGKLSLHIRAPYATDNCSGSVIGTTTDPVDFVSGTQGDFQIHWTFTDDAGNTSTTIQQIHIHDVTPPVVTCPGDITVTADVVENGQGGSHVTYNATATDNCTSKPGISYSIDPGSFFPIGTTPVTVTADDGHGNTSTCTFNVTVNCVTPVFTTCGTDKTVSNDAGQCGAAVSYTTAASGIPAASLSYTFSGATTGSGNGDGSGSFFNKGTTTVTVTATNLCGTATCTFKITVADNENPVITGLPTNISVGNDAGVCGAKVNWTAPSVSDNCPGATLVSDHQPGDLFPLGTTTVTYTATDAVGHTVTGSFTVTVADHENPVISCPGNYQLACGLTADPAITGKATATDNCGTPVITYSDVVSGNTITRTWKATDAAGNFSTCVQTITQSGPFTTTVASVPTSNVYTGGVSTSLYLGYGAQSTTLQTGVPAGGTYTYTWTDSGVSGLSSTHTANPVFSPAQAGSYNFAVTAVNQNGCTSTGYISICVTDIRVPAGMNTGDGGDDHNGNGGDDHGSGDDNHHVDCDHKAHSAADCPHKGDAIKCDHKAHSASQCPYKDEDKKYHDDSRSNGYSSHSGGTSEGGHSSYGGNNKDSHSGNNHVTCDHKAHSAKDCPHKDDKIPCDHKAHSADKCPYKDEENNDHGSGDDQHGQDNYKVFICHVPPGNPANPLTLSISINAVAAHLANHPGDRLGSCDQAPCSAYTDHVAPVINCPGAVTVDCGSSTIPTSTGKATATDNSGTVTITYHDASTQSADTNAAAHYNYTITRTWKATDPSGNYSECTQIITVHDVTDPVINCPGDVTIACSGASTGTATATDNSGGPVAITYTDQSNKYGFYRTWKATDVSGNTSTCTQKVTVRDDVKPVVTAPADKTISCGTSTAPSATGTATASDNCDNNPSVSYSDYTRNNTITRTWKATDASGNYATDVQVITIVDNTAPVITAPADKTISCGGSTAPNYCGGSATASDNCSGVTITYSDATNGNVTTRTWKATDASGNSATDVQTITMVDNVKPVISDPRDIMISCGSSTAPTSCGGSATATDNCGTPVVTYSDVTNGNVITRTWKATDAAGNYSTSTQIITIVDNTKPTITDPKDVTITCSGMSDPSVTGRATATDNCSTPVVTYSDVIKGNVITRTWTATDAAGNTNTSVQLITIKDNIAPVIACPGDKVVGCGGSTDPVATGYATATDNCSTTVVTYSDVMGDNGVITRTWKATDGAGNYSTCVQTITKPKGNPCTLPYPYVEQGNVRTSVTFNEGEVLRAIEPNASLACGTTPTQIKVWYNDEHPLTLGVRQVVVKTKTGTTTTNYPVSTYVGTASSVTNPQLGTTADGSSDQSGNDVADGGGRPLRPVLYISDITNDPNNRVGDWQHNGAAYAPDRVSGSWKAAVRTVDKTKSPAVVTITPDADPKTKNNWSMGAGGDVVPAGLDNEGYGAEIVWNISSLPLLPGHTYRIQVIVHDGDQNKCGGDAGQACAVISIPSNAVITSTVSKVGTATAENAVAPVTETPLNVTVMPNPSTTYFTLKIESKYQTPVNLRVMDASGRVIEAKSKLSPNGTVQIGFNYASGTYYAELEQEGRRKVVQLIKGRG